MPTVEPEHIDEITIYFTEGTLNIPKNSPEFEEMLNLICSIGESIPYSSSSLGFYRTERVYEINVNRLNNYLCHIRKIRKSRTLETTNYWQKQEDIVKKILNLIKNEGNAKIKIKYVIPPTTWECPV